MKYQINKENGITNRGNLTRLKRLMKRALEGEELTLGFLGGSITQGSLASDPKLCYAYRVYQWWCGTFPTARFHYVNAGIGGTTSQFGAARVQEDLLCHRPDFVITEFSVNDKSTEHFLETYEGVVRQIYGDGNRPAVMLVHNVYYNDGANAQLQHGKIGRHYGLPCVSMQSSIYPEVLAGRIANREITEDDLHPNDSGHELVASVICHLLEKALSEVEAGEEAEPPMPKPLTANTYENSICCRNYNTVPELKGFKADTAEQLGITDVFKKGWYAREKGASIRFYVEAGGIAVQYRKSVKRPCPVAKIVVDGEEENGVLLDGSFEADWGDCLALDTIVEHGRFGRHQVDITLVETHETDAVDFYLASLIVTR